MEIVARNIDDYSWVFIMLLCVLLLIGGSRFVFQKKFNALWNLNNFKDVQDNTIPFSFFINIVLSVLIGLILSPFTQPLFNIGTWTDFSHLIVIILIIIAYITLRFLLDGFISLILGLEDEYKTTTNIKTFFRIFTVLFLLLLNFALYYSTINKTNILYIALGVMVLTLILEYFQQINKSRNKAIYGSYYFILYLCVLEILPILYVVMHWKGVID